MEYKFWVYIYPLDEAEAAALRERLQDLILREVEERGGLFCGPVVEEINHQEEKAPSEEKEETQWEEGGNHG